MKVPIAEKTIDRLTNHRSGNKAKMFVSMVLHKHNKHNNGNHSNHHSSNNNTTRATNNLNNNNHINNNVSNLNQAFNSRAPIFKQRRTNPYIRLQTIRQYWQFTRSDQKITNERKHTGKCLTERRIESMNRIYNCTYIDILSARDHRQRNYNRLVTP
ncbi:uncharacterized protein LOC143153250 isoform X1 [Ptiloglossa arizonensis]|uniref:uncharacterized protein LOC143153250 isoform X1 n=1 Tax=Ptiloglossa arizonensis TaxID=3350558 RepID=UPI003FA188DF